GGNGTKDLAQAVVNVIEKGDNHYKPLYDWRLSIEEKIQTIAFEIYGANEVTYSAKAKAQIKEYQKLGFDKFPVCMAKTQKSLSDDERKIGRPTGFSITIREFEVAAGAGFIIPILGDMMRMPGLPAVPAAEGMDIDNDGKITGLS
ncbi:MAG TPA: formate--tetrahydrofolate ligase, partial [Saprospiraceae bacterium]|nr:formate--tetrahydrofolate ligase [Saprospiraceae bacterium]